MGRPEFTLDDVYVHEATLSALYPGNRIRDQVRDGGLAFNGRGTYRRT